MRFHDREADALWRQWLAEPTPRLSGPQMLERARPRLNALCFGDEADDAKAPSWPLSPAQEDAIAATSRAHAGPERLRAVADILEASPVFDWFSSAESFAAAGVDSDLRFHRAFHRLDLADGTYCMPNIGVVGPDGDNPSFPTDAHIPGWSGRWPSALALDAKGWAAVLWGSPRNLWRWRPTWLADGEDIDEMPRSLMDGWRREGMDGPACVDVGGGWVGVAHFTELWGFDGAEINEAAGRVLGIPPD